jgi:hypothetical protein
LVSVAKRVRDQFFDHALERLCEIGDDVVWFAVSGQRCSEERAGRGDVASW